MTPAGLTPGEWTLAVFLPVGDGDEVGFRFRFGSVVADRETLGDWLTESVPTPPLGPDAVTDVAERPDVGEALGVWPECPHAPSRPTKAKADTATRVVRRFTGKP
jgi:hypothetical protein